MTGYTVHTGSTEKFSEGWDQIFGQGKRSKKKPAASKSSATASDAKASKSSSAAKKQTKGK